MTTDALFDEIARFIADSHALLEAGAMMELAGLDDRVQSLCEAVLSLSQEERLRHAERLQFLLGELQALGDAMLGQREVMAREMQNVPQHKKANVAYRIVDASDSFGEKKEEE